MRKLSDIQILKLGKTLHHIKTNNFFYGQQYTDDRITTHEALAKLPFMTYEKLAQGYPFAYSCADTKGLVSAHMQIVNGEPVMNLFTDSDTYHIAEMTSRTFSIAEITDEDTILLISNEKSCPAFVSVTEKLRHFMIHGGDAKAAALYQLIKDTDATCLLGETKDIVEFVEFCRTNNLDITETSVRTGVFCGKPLTDGTRKHIEKETGAQIYMTSGFGTFLHGMATDCPVHEGLHLWDDHYIAEIINSETGDILPDSEEGELVITTLSLEALPLIRFRTGKKSSIITREKCGCGLHTVKISLPL